jgi:hypothetical protein
VGESRVDQTGAGRVLDAWVSEGGVGGEIMADVG